MANIKSAKKRVITTAKRTARNKAIRSSVKTAIKKVDAVLAQGNKEAAVAEFRKAEKIIAKACAKGIYHKNNAARKISALEKKVNKLA
ncbi:SSU ribosomal protein S20P [Acetitomaculum ruminis DSM 5522]|uniref:Small ribosomal subunit protein bS20 n=1 Tax=Acetitomaculum ruminis DSM 5522 TaxID=1120918 RepID=A0A1I0ZGP5_9FIRM|nr:30S ribosomal protein S20 [Acetitomaculum ruminis]SFB24542.1 SSU ribosomal protein S20P [Acetitomaculum ruminis DSM 5522]